MTTASAVPVSEAMYDDVAQVVQSYHPDQEGSLAPALDAASDILGSSQSARQGRDDATGALGPIGDPPVQEQGDGAQLLATSVDSIIEPTDDPSPKSTGWEAFSRAAGSTVATDPRDVSNVGPPKAPLLNIQESADVVPIMRRPATRQNERPSGKAGEKALFGLLTEVDSIEELVASDFNAAWVPTKELRPIFEWAIRQYKMADGLYAPTALMFRETQAVGHGGKSMADLLAEYDIDLDEAPYETVEWVIEHLRGRYLIKKSGEFTKLMAEEMTSCSAGEVCGTFQKAVNRVYTFAQRPEYGGAGSNGRNLTLTPLSKVPMRATHWLWEGRIALGSLSLLAGREGIGKSTVAYTLAAQVTTGTMQGYYLGKPHGVIIAASEDSFSQTIVPRLMAAKADLTKVFRVDVQADGVVQGIDLPTDLTALEALVKKEDVALILIDPLTSRLSETLDTHKDSDVRQALEPIVSLAERSDCVALGIIHVNKSSGKDAGNLIMGSRAFNAVARSVMMAIVSPEEPGLYLLAMSKNNLGRMDLDALTYRIEGECVGKDANDDEVWTGRIEWVGLDPRHISDLIEASSQGTKKSALDEAIEWLEQYLTEHPGVSPKELEAAASLSGHRGSLRRAKEALEVETVRLPGSHPAQHEVRLPELEVA